MSKLPDLPSYEFVVVLASPVEMSMEDRTVTSAYFQEERSYTLFKDAGHAVVAAFKTDSVIQVLRAEKPVEHAV